MEHKVSHTNMIQHLASKLPWTQVEKLCEYFKELDKEVKRRPFELFLKWLEKIGGAWEADVTLGVGRKRGERT